MPSIAARHVVTLTPALPPVLPLVAVLAAALALAQWPAGDIAGRDRELVARVTRAGLQRFDSDGGPSAADHGDVLDAGAPVGALEVASEAAGDGGPHVVVAEPPALVLPGWSPVRPAAVTAAAVAAVPAAAGRDRAPPRA